MKILDLSFQPSTYWPAAPSVDELLSSISGEARRAIVRDDPSRSVEPDDFLIKPTLSEAERRAWGSIHPALMGGEYLPELLEGQVEIARISLASTTGDQISIRARRLPDAIEYAVVDEYETAYVCTPERSIHPLTLGELIELIDGTEHPDDIASGGLVKSHWNFQFDESMPGYDQIPDVPRFTTVSSAFYPELCRYYAEEAERWVVQMREENPDEVDDDKE